MALIQFGDIVTGMRGSVGGATYGNSPAGFTKRNKPVPIQPISAVRTTTRSRFTYIQGLWRTLDDDQRTAWQAATINFPRVNSLGITYYLTGINLFCYCNMGQLYIGQPIITDPPAPWSFEEYSYGDQFIDVSALDFDYNFIFTPSLGIAFDVWATPSISPGISSPRNIWVRLGSYPDSTSMPFNIWNLYVAKVGIPLVGQNVWVKTIPTVVGRGLQATPVISKILVEA